MPKPRVAVEDKRIVISARVTPAGKDTLMKVGDGNISKGLDRIMSCWSEMGSVFSSRFPPAEDTPKPSST